MTQRIFTEQFGCFSIRFIHLSEKDAVFVSKKDMSDAIKDCMTEKVLPIADQVIESGFDTFAHESEKVGAVIEVDTIGSVIHVMAAGNFLYTLGDMVDCNQQELRESALRISVLCKWFVNASTRATEYFSVGFDEIMKMAVDHLDKHNPPLVVDATEFGGVWTAECDQIGLVTEADSFEELTERVWEIAPELAELNDFGVEGNSLRIKFEHTEIGLDHLSQAQ